MILTLARGNYCQKEHRQHLELAEHYPKIAVAYTQVVTIATDDHHALREFRASVGARWPFLSDPEHNPATGPTSPPSTHRPTSIPSRIDSSTAFTIGRQLALHITLR
ncbi:MAG TPA: hypothetical protein VMG38_26290 [Trebonia sp.]|nr:hypothetical protein [Trebonia sp.]